MGPRSTPRLLASAPSIHTVDLATYVARTKREPAKPTKVLTPTTASISQRYRVTAARYLPQSAPSSSLAGGGARVPKLERTLASSLTRTNGTLRRLGSPELVGSFDRHYLHQVRRLKRRAFLRPGRRSKAHTGCQHSVSTGLAVRGVAKMRQCDNLGGLTVASLRHFSLVFRPKLLKQNTLSGAAPTGPIRAPGGRLSPVST